jgi:hypothetical protein
MKLGTSKVTKWRTNKFIEGIKKGDFDSLIKFLRQRLKYQPINEVLNEAKSLNEKLFKKFLDIFLEEIAEQLVAYEEVRKVPYNLSREVVERLIANRREQLRVKMEAVERRFKKKMRELEPYYFYSLYEAKEILGEELFEYFRRNGFEFLKGERYYVEEVENLRGCLESIKGVLEDFEQELKEELLLAKNVLNEKQYEKLLLEVRKALRGLQKKALS